ncbi:MAG: DUF1858 domain-containing protein [Bacteroidota bacterium]
MIKPEIISGMQVAELVHFYPESVSFLASRNLHCIICGEPVWGTLEELAKDKHFGPDQLSNLVEELKAEITRSKS